MALQPCLQSVCELKLVQSTIGVVTNARADHLDVMGPTRLDVARALAGTTPVAGILFTAEECPESLHVMASASRDRGSQLEPISPFEKHRVTPEMLSGFPYLEHADNVALALRVCEAVGVDRDAAIRGMWAAEPDPGAMRVYRFPVGSRHWYFVNAFAANDPESTGTIWESAYDRFPGIRRRIAVMNCRAYRTDRSVTMAKACATWLPADGYVITGTGTERFTRTLISSGISPKNVHTVGDASGDEIIEAMTRITTEDTMILGMGNIAGPGMSLIELFQETELWTPRDPATENQLDSGAPPDNTSRLSLKAA